MDALNAPPFKSGLHSMRIDNCGPTYALQPLIWNIYELFSKLETRIKFDNVGRSFRCSTIEIHSELICSSFCNAGRVVTYDGSHAHVARAWNTVPNHDESRRLHPVPCTRDVRVSARPHTRRPCFPLFYPGIHGFGVGISPCSEESWQPLQHRRSQL